MDGRPSHPDGGDPRRVAVLAYDGMTLLDVAGPVEMFTSAGSGRPLYDVALVAERAGTVLTSSGVRMSVRAADRDRDLDTLVVPGADEVPPLDGPLVGQVADLAGRARRVASVCTGSFLLAEAGLLDGVAATTHWRYAGALQRRYPRTAVDADAIFVRAGRITTSAGVSAGIDLSLALVEDDHGAALAREVARSLVVFLRRPAGQSQFTAGSRGDVAGPVLRRVLEAVTADPAAEHTAATMSRTAGVSPRHLARLFGDELSTTPARFVEQARLEHAQQLLLTGAPVTAVARDSGFGSDETLRRSFRRRLGVTPTAYRDRFTSARR